MEDSWLIISFNVADESEALRDMLMGLGTM